MSKQAKMLASSIRETVAPALRLCPPECGIVSITDVEVSADFSYATIYISALTEVERALAYLESHVHQYQRSLSALGRRRIPLIRFRIDPRSDRGTQIDALLDDVS